MRVVSLVPSWTEFLHDLNVNVVGQTKFCVRPQTAFRKLPRVGGTKTVKVDKVMDLQPDLIVANREENDQGQIEALMAAMPSGSCGGDRCAHRRACPRRNAQTWGGGRP